MLRAILLPMSLLMAGTLTVTAARSSDAPGSGASADMSGGAPAITPMRGEVGAMTQQYAHGYHLSPAELAKLREQVRRHWMQRQGANGLDATADTRSPEGGSREIAR
jgi:hypothetical protein